ncbi:MAG: hypothetical protein V4515_04560 [Chloroflexota bacterium]
MTTYGLHRPRATHTRPASCVQVECPQWRDGWSSLIDESSDLGRTQGAWIRGGSGRRFTEHRTPAGPTRFDFAPGQVCFAAADHTVPLDRPPLYIVRGGDWRGNPRRIPVRRHTRAEDWRDDFGDHQQQLRDAQLRG